MMASLRRTIVLIAMATAALTTSAVGQNVLTSATAGPSRCYPAVRLDELPTDAPEAQGFDRIALCALLEKVATGPENIHSVLVLRRGRLVAELYREGLDATIYSLWRTSRAFGPSDRHDMRSVSKSIVSLLYGILLAEGKVPAVTTPVASLYPEFPELDTSRRRAIRVEHLLSMSTGLDWDEPSPIHRPQRDDQFSLIWRSSFYQCVFAHDVVARPGIDFVYSGGATSVLAEIMTRATKSSLSDLVQVKLFKPLNITDWEWSENLRGVPIAFGGLRLRPRDLMKVGALVLAGGVWNGQQVVSTSWITQSMQPRVDTGAGGYGYQWWTDTLVLNGRSHAVATALGNGGQTLVLIPSLELAVVTTAGIYNDPRVFPIVRGVAEQIAGAIVD